MKNNEKQNIEISMTEKQYRAWQWITKHADLNTILAQQIQNITFGKIEPEEIEEIAEIYRQLQNKWELEIEEENGEKSIVFRLQKRTVF